MALLSELRDKMSKCLTIQLPLNEVNEDFIVKIDGIIKTNTEHNPNRNCQLKFMVLDYDNNVSLEMPSKNVKIFPSNEFLDHLREINKISYKLN